MNPNVYMLDGQPVRVVWLSDTQHIFPVDFVMATTKTIPSSAVALLSSISRVDNMSGKDAQINGSTYRVIPIETAFMLLRQIMHLLAPELYESAHRFLSDRATDNVKRGYEPELDALMRELKETKLTIAARDQELKKFNEWYHDKKSIRQIIKASYPLMKSDRATCERVAKLAALEWKELYTVPEADCVHQAIKRHFMERTPRY